MRERPLDERGLPEGYPLQDAWEVTPRKYQEARQGDSPPVLLDVREPAEVAAAAIDGALCIPMGEIKNRLTLLDEHAETPMVVLCHHGARSLQVTAFLRQQGFDDVRSLAGGIDLWSRDIDAAVPRY